MCISKTKTKINQAFIVMLSVVFLALLGCECVPQKSFNCTIPVNDAWQCTPLEGSSRPFECTYISEEPECIPEWCDLPVQDCNLPPLTGGTDSCGNPCTKPSPEWPNCIQS
jgi:hypothetical protein